MLKKKKKTPGVLCSLHVSRRYLFIYIEHNIYLMAFFYKVLLPKNNLTVFLF